MTEQICPRLDKNGRVIFGAFQRGKRWEEWATNEFQKRGYRVDAITAGHQRQGTRFDLLLDGTTRVEVKSDQPDLYHGRYRVAWTNVKKWSCVDRRRLIFFDFLVGIVTLSQPAVFVIPASEIHSNSVSFLWPPSEMSKYDYQEFYNRWDLIPPPAAQTS